MNRIIVTFIFILFVNSCTQEIINKELTINDSIRILASDEYQGRAPGTEGGKLTKNFIAQAFKDNKLQPIKNNYFLEVPAVDIRLLPKSFFSISYEKYFLASSIISFRSEYSFDFSAKSFLSIFPDDRSFSSIECLLISSSMVF